MQLRTIPLPASVRRMLPGQAYDWGPPRREEWISDYCQGTRAGHHRGLFRPGFTVEPPPSRPTAFLGETLRFRGWPNEFHPVGTVSLRGGWVLGNHGFVVDQAGTYLIDSNMWFPARRHTPAFGMLKRLTRRVLPGRSVSFLSLWANDNYCHFLLEAIPRIAVFLAAGHTWNDVDHVLLPRFSGPSARWVLDRLAVPPDKIRHVAFGEYLCCDELIATSHPGSPRIVPTWSAGFLRDLAGNPPGRTDRRLFIPRRATRRRLVNELDIEKMLVREFGFEVLGDQIDADEVATMRETALVVGPHGAGLSRTAFCRPGTQIIELFSPSWTEPYYWTLAVAGNRRYTPIMGRTVGRPTRLPFWDAGVEDDFTVDVETVRNAVRAAVVQA